MCHSRLCLASCRCQLVDRAAERSRPVVTSVHCGIVQVIRHALVLATLAGELKLIHTAKQHTTKLSLVCVASASEV